MVHELEPRRETAENLPWTQKQQWGRSHSCVVYLKMAAARYIGGGIGGGGGSSGGDRGGLSGGSGSNRDWRW